MLDREGNLVKTTEAGELHGAHGEVDHEDTGEKGFNYRSERFYNRLKQIPLAYKLFDSKVHGDPATPCADGLYQGTGHHPLSDAGG